MAPAHEICIDCGAWRGELGQEPTLDCVGWATGTPCGVCYICHLVEVFRAVWRVLRPDGTLWLNLGDSYSMDSKWGGYSGGTPKQDSRTVGYTRPRRTTGLGDKQLMGVPWRAAFALQAAGWLLRADNIWHKPNVLPESVTDRPTKAHEYLFLFAQQPQYYYDADAIKEPTSSNTHSRGTGLYPKLAATPKESRANERWARSTTGAVTERNKRSVWTIPTAPYPDAHFSTFPPALVEPCVLAGSRPGDIVLDPFAGTGTTLAVALTWRRQGIGCELNPASAVLTEARIAQVTPINLDLAAVGAAPVAADQSSLWNEVSL